MLVLTGFAAALIVAACGSHVLLRRRVPQMVEEDSVWAWLTSRTPWSDDRYDAESFARLPPAARRFLAAAVEADSPKRTVIEAFTTASGGRLWPGAPPAALHLHQVIAAPYGGLWKYVSTPLPLVSGSAGVSGVHRWHRLRAFGLLPLGGVPRGDSVTQHLWLLMLAQGAVWSPGSLFPGAFVEWVDHESEARCVVRYKGNIGHLQIDLDAAGRARLVTASSEQASGSPLVVRVRPLNFTQVDGRSLAVEAEVDSSLAGNCRVRLDHVRSFESWDRGPRL